MNCCTVHKNKPPRVPFSWDLFSAAPDVAFSSVHLETARGEQATHTPPQSQDQRKGNSVSRPAGLGSLPRQSCAEAPLSFRAFVAKRGQDRFSEPVASEISDEACSAAISWRLLRSHSQSRPTFSLPGSLHAGSNLAAKNPRRVRAANAILQSNTASPAEDTTANCFQSKRRGLCDPWLRGSQPPWVYSQAIQT